MNDRMNGSSAVTAMLSQVGIGPVLAARSDHRDLEPAVKSELGGTSFRLRDALNGGVTAPNGMAWPETTTPVPRRIDAHQDPSLVVSTYGSRHTESGEWF
jgi:hypothetical protein